MQTHEQMMAELNAQVVGEVNGRTVTRGELSAAFNKVKNAEHWKYPVRCTLESATDDDLAMIEEAVVFFTGSVPQFHRYKNGKVRVSAEGYYRAIGA